MRLSTESATVKEPFLFTFSIEQLDRSKVMFFDIRPHQKGFFFKRLDKNVDDTFHHRKALFTYLVYALQPYDGPLRFDLTVKQTNDKRIELSTTGGRYNVKDIETTDLHETLSTPILHITSIPKQVPLVGEFHMRVSVDKSSVSARTPVYLKIHLEGIGAMPEPFDFTPKIEGAEIFTDDPHVTLRYSKDGVHYEATYLYALLSDRSFTVPAYRLQAWSYKKRKFYSLESTPLSVQVKTVPIRQLVDERNMPQSVFDMFEDTKEWLIYLLVFMSGYLSALLITKLRGRRRLSGASDIFAKEVRQAKDARALLTLLLHKDAQTYASFITDLEKAVYRGENIPFKQIKKEILRHG
ncbi:hypothetical protein HCR_21300 [Hydrogenimonas cancrithermarum]|uniref:BatD n=2 Tax=Hydrogenimonas cancrithermarum TaxID=2993563 RepID=A0ABN6WXD2_9BACT|nr:hypothetical protein HCR_21300 [Hydrogenimonas cancrithermarum]